MRTIALGLVLVSTLAIVGCCRFFTIQGRAIETGEISYEFIESRAEFEKRLGDWPRLANLTFRLYAETYEGEREWELSSYYPHEQEHGDFLAVWQVGMRFPNWTRLVIECDGFEPVEIHGHDLPGRVHPEFLLIRMKRKP